MDDSVITCESCDKETKTIATIFNENNATCKTQDCYILSTFLLITPFSLIAI